MIHFLYKTTNLLNQEYYFGAHSTQHVDDGYIGSGIRLVRSVQKYRKKNFIREIISYHTTEEQLYLNEKVLIKDYLGKPECLNLSEGGKGGWTYVNTVVFPYLKENGLYKKPCYYGKKNPMYGKHHSDETKQKLKKILTVKYSTDEWRQKHRQIQIDLGREKPLSERLSQSQKTQNKPMSEERKRHLSNVLSGKPGGSKNKIVVRSAKYKVNIGIPKELQDIFMSHGFLNKMNKIEKVNFLGNLPFNLKNIFMKLPEKNYSKRVRSLREALALCEIGMITNCKEIYSELLKIKIQVDKEMNDSQVVSF